MHLLGSAAGLPKEEPPKITRALDESARAAATAPVLPHTTSKNPAWSDFPRWKSSCSGIL